ncbi:MAG: hypothetical protein C4555_00065 [Dehalococcoidia bacterium]|nr:MAG: hypothetical protein C4555_00065 [Dehalococcoidia bacterium]
MMDWLNLAATALLLYFAIQAVIWLIKWRTTYHLILFLAVSAFLLVALSNLVYPGRLNSLLRAVTYLFSDSPAAVRTVGIAFYVILWVLLSAILFYPNVKRFLKDPWSIKNQNKRESFYRFTLRLFPRKAEILSGYALFLWRVRRDYNKAKEYCGKALEIDSNNSTVLGTYAIILEEKGDDYDSADSYYRQAVQQSPKNAANLTNYARFLMYTRKDYPKAQEYYQAALKLDPKNPNALVGQAKIMGISKDYDQAEDYYNKAIKADPKDVYSLSYYAYLLHTVRKDYARAEQVYKRAIALKPPSRTMAGLMTAYGSLLADMGRNKDESAEYYLKAIEADPNYAYSLYSYARYLWLTREDYDKAEEYFRRAVDSESQNDDVLYDYAYFISDERKDYDHAQQLFEKSVSADPSNAYHLAGYAFFLMDTKKDYDKAETFLRRAIDLEPDDPRNLGSYALLLATVKGDYDQADQLYKKAINLDPNDAYNLANYAQFLILRGSLDEALVTITQAFKHNQRKDNQSLELRLWFYRYALFPQEFPDSETAIENLFKQDVTSLELYLKGVLEAAKKKGHPDFEKLSQYANRLIA